MDNDGEATHITIDLLIYRQQYPSLANEFILHWCMPQTYHLLYLEHKQYFLIKCCFN